MTRDRALQISDTLAEGGISHTINVYVADGYMPRERYTVNITPTLAYASTDITALQRLADKLKLNVAFCAGSFTFEERK